MRENAICHYILMNITCMKGGYVCLIMVDMDTAEDLR